MIYKNIKILALALLACSLSGCALFHVYRPVISQGNIICNDAVQQLRPGMTADQVLYLMGTPILTNTFEPTRWDYVYSYKKGADPRIQHHVTLYFQGGILQAIQISPCQIIR